MQATRIRTDFKISQNLRFDLSNPIHLRSEKILK
jgi:hypothetical protein